MTTVGIFEAKAKLSELLERVAKGERVTITKHNQPIADLVPHRPIDRERAQRAAQELREFAKDNRLKGLKIKDLVDRGRPGCD
jgi:prevent-host-death family protein